MPIQKQNVPLSLNQGINTKIDPKQLPLGKFQNIKNIRFDKEAEFNKRYGYDKVDNAGIGVTNNEPVIGVTSFGDQLLWISRDQVYSYSSSGNAWQGEGSYDAVVPESEIILQNGKEQTNLQCVYLEGYKVFGWIEDGKVMTSVVDDSTKSFVVHNIEIPDVASSGSITNARMTSFDNGVFYFYVDPSRVLKYKEFNLLGYIKDELEFISTSTVSAGRTAAFTDEYSIATLASNQRYDAVGAVKRLICGYYDNAASEMRFFSLTKDRTRLANVDVFGTTAVTPHETVDISKGPLGRVAVVTSNGHGVVKFSMLANDMSLLMGPTTIEDVTSTGYHSARLASAASKDGLNWTIFYQVYKINPKLHTISAGTTADSTVANLKYTWSQFHVRKNTITYPGNTVGTATTVASGVGLASKAFVQDQNIYINTIRESKLQAAYYTMKEDGSIQAKISPGNAGSILNSTRKRADSSTWASNYSGTNVNANYVIPSLTNVEQISSEKFLFANKIQGRIIGGASGSTTYFSLYGVNSSILDFSNEIVNQTESLGENLHLSGGQLKAYDGNVLVEQGFNYPPDVVHAAAGATGTGTSFPAGTASVDNDWQYLAVYNWTDAQGNVFKSALSEQATFTISTGGTAVDNVSVYIPTIPLTQKNRVYIELYRTEVNKSVFYKVNADSSSTVSQTFTPIENTSGADFVLFTDSSPDASIVGNENIYTTGGVVENISPPSNSIIASFKNRLFLGGLENKLELRYSKLLNDKVGIGFNDTFSILTSQVGGDIIALEGMDDKLIIFKRNAIFYLAGDGPNNLGEQDTFIEPQLISSDVGCTVKNSVILGPHGIFFKSNKGIYLLSRSMQLDYIGAAVEDFNELSIASADVVAKDNEVRFLTSDGDCLVYNYFRQFWSTYINHRGVSSVTIGDDYYYVHVDGSGNKLYKQNSSRYDDAGSPVNMMIETGWINPFQAQGAMRIYRMLLLGDYFTPHRLKVSIAYDYNDEYSQSKIVDIAGQTEVFRYGEPGVTIESGVDKKGYYGDPGGTTGDYTTAIAYGGKDVMQYQYRLDFAKQKCESFKLKIETVQGAGELGRGVNLSQILFVTGFKGTDYKIKQSRIFGVS